jgi:hypothetical protein
MKKTAVAVLVLALFFMSAFVMPVMATPQALSPAWHTVPVTDTYHEVTYDQLTVLCLEAGLSKNPYPAPTVPTVVGPDANGMLYVLGGSDYYVFTFTIGGEVYQGVSCGIFDLTLNLVTGNGHMVYTQAPHYIGDLGKMNHGFDCAVTVDLYGIGTLGYYYTASYLFQGFGKFNHQTMVTTEDTRVAAQFGSGYCLVLGNRVK